MKYLHTLLYATETCLLFSRDIGLHFIDFTIARALVNIFGTGSAVDNAECRQRSFILLSCYRLSNILKIRRDKFLHRFASLEK